MSERRDAGGRGAQKPTVALPPDTALHPTTVLRREPRGRVTALADGRLLLRHPRGLTVLGGVTPNHLQRLLDQFDGRRTLAGVIEALAAEFEAAGVRDVTAVLLRCGMLRPVGAQPLADGVVTVRGGGAGELAAVLRAAGIETTVERPPSFDAPAPSTEARGDGATPPPALRIALAGGATWGELLRLQRRTLTEGLALLPVVLEPDGIHLGPWVVPARGVAVAASPSAAGPCLGCAAADRFRALSASAEPGGGLDELRTLAPAELADPRLWQDALGRVSRAVAAVLAATGGDEETEHLLGGTLHLPADGALPRRARLRRDSRCPDCGPPTSSAAADVDSQDAALSPDEPRSLHGPGSAAPPHRASRIAGALAERADEVAVEPRAVPIHRVRVSARETPPTVLVLGGGSAGHLAALALRRRHPRTRVTLVESPDVPVIGVGEATTPLTPQFLHADLGLDPRDLFRHVEPTLKLGIRFDWGRPAPHVFHYPFGPLRLAGALAHDGGVATASLQALLMAAGRVPLLAAGGSPATSPRARFGTAVAYHLDNRRFVAWLRRQAERAGVERVSATIAEVRLDGDSGGSDAEPRVAELRTDDGRRFAADLYVDCTGFRSLLVGDALGSPFVPFSRSLFTDRAVVATQALDGPPPPYTRADTWDAGWCWSTPQRHEDHRGYVYASAFLSDDDAVAELGRRLPAAGEPRVLRFRCGRRAHFLRGNVAALGNAYGFVEPLESTALHLLIRQIGLLLGAYPWRRGETGRACLLNRTVAGWWDYMAWFLALHYRFNGRLDTPFWRACRAEVDVTGWGELLDVYRQSGLLSADPAVARTFDAPDPLWGAEGVDLLLLGQGVRPASRGDAEPRAAEHRAWLAAARRLVGRALPHADALAAFDADPSRVDALAAPFLAAGPAFG